MTRAPTLPTLLRRADAIRAKGDAIFEAQEVADRAIRIEARRQAMAALAKRSIVPRQCLVAFCGTHAARWYPGPYRLDRVEVYPAKDMQGAFEWRAEVTVIGFRKNGKPKSVAVRMTFSIQRPADLVRELKLVRDTT